MNATQAQEFVQNLWKSEGEVMHNGVRQKCDSCDAVYQQSKLPILRYPGSYKGDCVVCGHKLRVCPCI